MVNESLIRFVLEGYLKAYSKKPKTTIIVSILVAFFIGFMAYVDTVAKEKKELQVRSKYLEYDSQLTQLDITVKNLKDLLLFVHSQKSKLQESQSTIEKLKQEHQTIKPLVDADKKVIDALFSVQENRYKNRVWLDRLYGFVFGVLASLLASAIWFLGARSLNKFRQ